MTQTKVKFSTFEAYLAWSSSPENASEERFELIDGKLFAVPPEKELNNWIARCLMLRLIMNKQIPARLVITHSLELQVPVLRPQDSANRFPDLVVLRPEHPSMMAKRLTITLEMPPPEIVVEVMSSGTKNRDRDLIFKRDQYAAREIPEYWLIDPEVETISVLKLKDDAYVEMGLFKDNVQIKSSVLSNMTITAANVFSDDQSALI